MNPYLVLRSGGYTKHYYIEGQRIVSKLGGGLDNKGQGPLKAGNDKVNYSNKQEESREGIVRNLKFPGRAGWAMTELSLQPERAARYLPVRLLAMAKIPAAERMGRNSSLPAGRGRYFYHPDHLGSSSYITDASGEVYQHLEYFAFGEMRRMSIREHQKYRHSVSKPL